MSADMQTGDFPFHGNWYWAWPPATITTGSSIALIPFDLAERLNRIEKALEDLGGMQETIEILQQPEVARAIMRARKRMEKGKNWREVVGDE